jgi:thiol:disulfide interchange protein
MAIRAEHEIHSRRRSRNIGLGLVLVCFVALVFTLTIVKVRQGELLEAFDHQPRVSLTPLEDAPQEVTP